MRIIWELTSVSLSSSDIDFLHLLLISRSVSISRKFSQFNKEKCFESFFSLHYLFVNISCILFTSNTLFTLEEKQRPNALFHFSAYVAHWLHTSCCLFTYVSFFSNMSSVFPKFRLFRKKSFRKCNSPRTLECVFIFIKIEHFRKRFILRIFKKVCRIEQKTIVNCSLLFYFELKFLLK